MIRWLLQMLISNVSRSAILVLHSLCIFFSWLIFSSVDLIVRLNAAYLSTHGSAIFGRTLWMKTSSLTQQAQA
jgi:hypothetical protein